MEPQTEQEPLPPVLDMVGTVRSRCNLCKEAASKRCREESSTWILESRIPGNAARMLALSPEGARYPLGLHRRSPWRAKLWVLLLGLRKVNCSETAPVDLVGRARPNPGYMPCRCRSYPRPQRPKLQLTCKLLRTRHSLMPHSPVQTKPVVPGRMPRDRCTKRTWRR